MKRICVISFILSMVFVFSCDGSHFAGSKEIKDTSTNILDDQGVLKTVSIECNKNQLDVSSTESISGSSKTKVVISGNICLNGKNTIIGRKINIIFVVDTSGSTDRADKLIDGTCNRKKAIEKVINLMAKEATSSNIKGAVITFDTNASTVGWSDLSSVPTNGLCNCGGAHTNYEAAFDKVKELLSGKNGINVVYFMTDGAPEWWVGKDSGNYDWEEGRKGGRRGIESLRAAVPEVLINTLYFVDPNAGMYGTPSKEDTYNYLLELMKDPSRIKQTNLDSGETIVDKITDFEENIPAGTLSSSNDLTATVTVGESSKNLKIDSLTQVSEGVYKYSLEEVYLEGNPGSVVDNVFKVVGKGSDGSSSVSKVTVKFSQTN